MRFLFGIQVLEQEPHTRIPNMIQIPMGVSGLNSGKGLTLKFIFESQIQVWDLFLVFMFGIVYAKQVLDTGLVRFEPQIQVLYEMGFRVKTRLGIKPGFIFESQTGFVFCVHVWDSGMRFLFRIQVLEPVSKT